MCNASHVLSIKKGKYDIFPFSFFIVFGEMSFKFFRIHFEGIKDEQ